MYFQQGTRGGIRMQDDKITKTIEGVAYSVESNQVWISKDSGWLETSIKTMLSKFSSFIKAEDRNASLVN